MRGIQATGVTVINNTQSLDFPGGPVGKNPPSIAGDAGSIHGQGGKIPHAAGQLSLSTATTEPVPSKRAPMPQQKPSAARIFKKMVVSSSPCPFSLIAPNFSLRIGR